MTPKELGPPLALLLHFLPPACSILNFPLVSFIKGTLPAILACCGLLEHHPPPSPAKALSGQGTCIGKWQDLLRWEVSVQVRVGMRSWRAAAERSAARVCLSARWRAGVVGVRV